MKEDLKDLLRTFGMAFSLLAGAILTLTIVVSLLLEMPGKGLFAQILLVLLSIFVFSLYITVFGRYEDIKIYLNNRASKRKKERSKDYTAVTKVDPRSLTKTDTTPPEAPKRSRYPVIGRTK